MCVFLFLRLVVMLFRQRINKDFRRSLNEVIDCVIKTGIWVILLMAFVVRTYYIPSESMCPTLQINDHIFVSKVPYYFSSPDRGDVIVFYPPHRHEEKGVTFIKRVVALENDVVQVSDGVLYVNGTPMSEPYIKELIFNDYPAYKVPPGHLFVMGDNRNNSDDSRYWGPLPKRDVVGRAFLIFWPFNRFAKI